VVFNRQLLFIHIPKAGGTSCTNYLCQHLEGPIFSSSLKSTLEDHHFNAKLISGYSHETLEEAYGDHQRLLADTGIDIRDVPEVLAVIRHPYSLELSIYNFYRNGRSNVLQAKPFQTPEVAAKIELAQGDIKNFVERSGYFRTDSEGRGLRTEDYLMLDGELPTSLTLLKMETLDADFPASVKHLVSPTADSFERANVTMNPRKLTEDALDAGAREAIYQKHRWLFDSGYYEAW